MTLSSLRRTAVSSSTVQVNSSPESLLVLSPRFSSSYHPLACETVHGRKTHT